MSGRLIRPSENGLYCEAANTYLDPHSTVESAVVSHGHADHAAVDSESLHATSTTGTIVEHRYDHDPITHDYGERFDIDGVRFSFHPANHIRGSAMILVEHDGERWLYTGDYKAAEDPTTESLEVPSCDTIITESTFALPIYQWRDPSRVIDDLVDWVNSLGDETTILYAYSLGKAQRLLMELSQAGVKKQIYVHGSVKAMNEAYRETGCDIPRFETADLRSDAYEEGIVVAPQSIRESTTVQRLKNKKTAMISGWMRVRGNQRWRGYDNGFALSDHCDWQGLVDTIKTSGAEHVIVNHGYTEAFASYLTNNGWDAEAWDI